MSILIAQEADAETLRRGSRRFLWGSLLLFLLIFVAILVRQGLLQQTATLQFMTDSAQDLNQGQSVKIAGFRVGSVQTVTLRPDGVVAVVMTVDTDYMKFVTRDAVVELRKEGFVGSAALEILPGQDKTTLAANEATLTFVRSEGLTAVANSLRDKMIPVLDDIKLITRALADPDNGISASLVAVRQGTAQINTVLSTANTQLGSVGASVQGTLAQAQGDLGRLGTTLDTVNRDLPVLLTKAQRVVDHVQAVAAQAETSVPPALREGRGVVGDVKDMVGGVKSAWPMRHLVEPSDAARLVMDSDPQALSGAPGADQPQAAP